MSEPRSLYTHPIHLGLGATAVPQPEFDGEHWYEDYSARTEPDGKEGRLVGLHRFEGSWDSWEMHPSGAEVVLCLEGAMTIHQEHADGSTDEITLGPGEYAINPAGTWHTADVEGTALALFITSGLGTTHRAR